MKKLYLWASITDPEAAFKAHLITRDQAHAILFKHPMLEHSRACGSRPRSASDLVSRSSYPLNRWSLAAGRRPLPNVRFWQIKFENVSGIGVVIYSLTMTAVAIDWVMSLDVTWYFVDVWLSLPGGPGICGFRGVHPATLKLSKAEPIKSLLRPVNSRLGQALLSPLSCSISTSPIRNF